MTTRVAIQCDSGVSAECLSFSDTFPTKKGARNASYRDGWQRVGSMDICPRCHKRTLTVIWKDEAMREAEST